MDKIKLIEAVKAEFKPTRTLNIATSLENAKDDNRIISYRQPVGNQDCSVLGVVANHLAKSVCDAIPVGAKVEFVQPNPGADNDIGEVTCVDIEGGIKCYIRIVPLPKKNPEDQDLENVIIESWFRYIEA